MLSIGDGCWLRVGGRIVCIGSGLGVKGRTFVVCVMFELSGVEPIGGLAE